MHVTLTPSSHSPLSSQNPTQHWRPSSNATWFPKFSLILSLLLANQATVYFLFSCNILLGSYSIVVICSWLIISYLQVSYLSLRIVLVSSKGGKNSLSASSLTISQKEKMWVNQNKHYCFRVTSFLSSHTHNYVFIGVEIADSLLSFLACALHTNRRIFQRKNNGDFDK